MKTYSTVQVARAIGVHKQTLLRWMWAGKVAEPPRRTYGGQDVRIWTDRDLQRAMRYKQTNYYKGGGRKKKT